MTARLLFILAAMFIAGCGAKTSILPEPFTRERADGKIPVKTELIRAQVRAELSGIPEGEAEVARWQAIEADYHSCRLSSGKAEKAAEQVFADCMANLGYVYMYPVDAEQLHNDIAFDMEKEYDKLPAAERKAAEERIAAERKAEEERVAAEKKRQEEIERIRRQKELGDALINAWSASGDVNTAEAKRLIDDGANINAKDKYGSTPLHYVARWGQIEIAHALIKAGAHVNAKMKNGTTPLHMASGWGKSDIALVLIQSGADINAIDNNGSMPLHVAAFMGQRDVARVLINAGAHIQVPNNSGHTPLDYARNNKQWSVVNLLQNLPPPPPSGESAPNVATAPAPEDSNVAEHVFEKAWRSVVYIETYNSQGGGVIIKPNIVATNCHVVDSGGIVVYKSHNRRTDKSTRYRATIRLRDDKNDFCLLDVSGLFGVPADVRRYDTLRIGESVYGIGSPKGLDLSLTSGLVSQKRRADGVRYIQTDTAISPGSSGGGLFDRKGNLVGILTSKFVDEEVEGIGFAIPADLAL